MLHAPDQQTRPADGRTSVEHSLRSASRALGTRDPLPYVGGLIDRTFYRPDDDASYARNALAPGAVPYEPSFSESEPDILRFTIEPLGPSAPPVARRDEATREMRRLIAPLFGRDALRWFDSRSEEWRGFGGLGWMNYGAWFGSAFDEDGLYAAKIYYELHADADRRAGARPRAPHAASDGRDAQPDADLHVHRLQARHRQPARHVPASRAACGDRAGPLMNRLGIGHQLPSLMRIVGRRAGRPVRAAAGGVLVGIARNARRARAQAGDPARVDSRPARAIPRPAEARPGGASATARCAVALARSVRRGAAPRNRATSPC